MDQENPQTESTNRTPFRFKLFLYGFLGTLLFLLIAVITAPMVVRDLGRNPDPVEATSNLRQIGLALFEFETEYGTFPNEETAKQVAANNPENKLDLSGDSSNSLFRQLIAAKITQSEQMFYAKASGVQKPDGNISPGHALERGEVAYGCVSGISTAGNPARIVAFCPVILGTDRFDPKPFDGKAVLLRIDNSVTSIQIDKNGHAIVRGQNILSPDHPVWGGVTFKIHYPELDIEPPGFFQRLFSK